MWLKATNMPIQWVDYTTSWQLTRFYEINTSFTHLRIFNACWISYGKQMSQIYNTGSSINYAFPEMLRRFYQPIVSDTFWSGVREPDINHHNTARSLQTSAQLQDLLYHMGAFNHRTACRLPRSAWTKCFWTHQAVAQPFPSAFDSIQSWKHFITISRACHLKPRGYAKWPRVPCV